MRYIINHYKIVTNTRVKIKKMEMENISYG